ncbi:MAG: PKD domain-containing protein [Bacteroidota bacterium]
MNTRINIFLIPILLLAVIMACTEEFVGPQLNADFTQTRLLIAKGDTIIFGDRSGGKPDEYRWLFEGGSPAISEDRRIVVSYEDTGSFDVTLIVKKDGVTDSIVRENWVRVFENTLEADFSADSTDIPVGTEIQFTDESMGDVRSWLWNFELGDPISSTDQSPRVFYSQPGSYDVTLSVNGFLGSDSVQKNNYINVYGPITANFKANTTVVRANEPIQFTDASTGSPTAWEWLFRKGNELQMSNDPNPLTGFGETGYWRVILTAANPIFQDTKFSEVEFITVHEPLVASISGMENIPVNEGAQLQGNYEGWPAPTSWSWTFENASPRVSSEQNPLPVWSTTGTFNVRLTVDNGITASTAERDIVVYIPLQADLLMEERLTSTYDLPAQFSSAFRPELNFKLVTSGTPEPITYRWTLTHEGTGVSKIVETTDNKLLASLLNNPEADILLTTGLGVYSLSVEANTAVPNSFARQVCSPCFEYF